MTDPELTPDRRKHGYAELEEKIDKHQLYLEGRLRRFFLKCLGAFAVLGITSALGLLGFGVVLRNQEQADESIQKQRYDTIVLNCREQNQRHNKTVEQLEAVTPKDRPDRAERIAGTILLINALQPFNKDCEAFARVRVKEQP